MLKTKVLLAAAILALTTSMLIIIPVHAATWTTIEKVTELVLTVYYTNGYKVKWYVEYIIQTSTDGKYVQGFFTIIRKIYKDGILIDTDKIGTWLDQVSKSWLYALRWILQGMKSYVYSYIASRFWTIPVFGYFPRWLYDWICPYCRNCGWCNSIIGPTISV